MATVSAGKACAARDGHRPLILRRERGALAARRVRRVRELERLRVKHNNLWRFSTPPDHKCILFSLRALRLSRSDTLCVCVSMRARRARAGYSAGGSGP